MQLPDIDKSALLPLYHQMYTALRDNIVAGAWKAGERLPSESELCESFGVSRITAQKALRRLVEERLVVRRQGQGSFVAERVAAPPMPGSLQALIDNVAVLGSVTTGRILEFGERAPAAAVRAALRLAPGERAQRSVHLRLREGEPFGHMTTWVPRDIGRGIGPRDIERAPMLALLAEQGVRAAWAAQSIGAEPASRAVAAALGVAAGAPLVRLQRVVHDAGDRPVEHITARYRADRYEYRTVLRREPGGLGPAGGGWSL